jgi:iron complex transport system ATP-binding protein
MASPEPLTAATSGAAIEVAGLGYSYGDRRTLDGVDLRVEPGEIVGLVGPNGSGKSTLIKILSKVLEGYAGLARVDGNEVRSISSRDLARIMAVVPQESTFGFPFSVLEIVLMARHPHLAGLAFESKDDIRIARESLDRCGALAFESRTIHELSSGERQRVVFARALAQEPRLLLLDEPASFLDIRHQVELYDIVRRGAGDGGCSVLTVLHDLNLAAEYCDRIYLLREGRIEAGGPTEEVFTYANLTRVFQTEVYVDTNDLTGKLLVVPLSGQARDRLRRKRDD